MTIAVAWAAGCSLPEAEDPALEFLWAKLVPEAHQPPYQARKIMLELMATI